MMHALGRPVRTRTEAARLDGGLSALPDRRVAPVRMQRVLCQSPWTRWSMHSRIVVANRWFPSIRTCTRCAAINADLILADGSWSCPCGVVHDRDVTAAADLLRLAASTQFLVARQFRGDDAVDLVEDLVGDLELVHGVVLVCCGSRHPEVARRRARVHRTRTGGRCAECGR